MSNIQEKIYKRTTSQTIMFARLFFGKDGEILCAFWHFPPRVGGSGKCCVARDFGVRTPSAFGSFDELRSHLAPYFSSNTKSTPKDAFCVWRRRRDSNSRAREGKLISSQPRYDLFDTSPYSNFVIVSRGAHFVKNDN